MFKALMDDLNRNGTTRQQIFHRIAIHQRRWIPGCRGKMQMSREENDKRIDEMADWAFHDGPKPEWMADYLDNQTEPKADAQETKPSQTRQQWQSNQITEATADRSRVQREPTYNAEVDF